MEKLDAIPFLRPTSNLQPRRVVDGKEASITIGLLNHYPATITKNNMGLYGKYQP